MRLFGNHIRADSHFEFWNHIAGQERFCGFLGVLMQQEHDMVLKPVRANTEILLIWSWRWQQFLMRNQLLGQFCFQRSLQSSTWQNCQFVVFDVDNKSSHWSQDEMNFAKTMCFVAWNRLWGSANFFAFWQPLGSCQCQLHTHQLEFGGHHWKQLSLFSAWGRLWQNQVSVATEKMFHHHFWNHSQTHNRDTILNWKKDSS